MLSPDAKMNLVYTLVTFIAIFLPAIYKVGKKIE